MPFENTNINNVCRYVSISADLLPLYKQKRGTPALRKRTDKECQLRTNRRLQLLMRGLGCRRGGFHVKAAFRTRQTPIKFFQGVVYVDHHPPGRTRSVQPPRPPRYAVADGAHGSVLKKLACLTTYVERHRKNPAFPAASSTGVSFPTFTSATACRGATAQHDDRKSGCACRVGGGKRASGRLPVTQGGGRIPQRFSVEPKGYVLPPTRSLHGGRITVGLSSAVSCPLVRDRIRG